MQHVVAEETKKGDWHQTMVGRLLFNASVELYGLKVEYRDADCVGIISVASLRAFSAGADWQSRFVSLNADSDPRRTDSTTAVPMRKLVKLAGLHWVMIPRRRAESADDDRNVPQLDRDSFESKSPIVDGIGVTLRVLLCTGTAYTDAQPDRLAPGLHLEVDVDIEDPVVNLTARQLKWIDHIIKHGFGLQGKLPRSASQTTSLSDRSPSLTTKRRPRSVYPLPMQQSSEHANGLHGRPYGDSTTDGVQQSVSFPGAKPGQVPPPPSDTDSYYSVPNLKPVAHDVYADEQVGAEIEEISDFEEDEEQEYEEFKEEVSVKPAQGGLRSFWRAIISENGDETVDDAAIALGLSNGNVSEDENEESFEEPEQETADYQYAREAVEAAANAGGLTMQLRVKTPDTGAWDLVDRLREELQEEKDVRKRLENLGNVLEEAEQRVRESEEDVRVLKGRNAALVQELEDLERMTSQAGKNKDAMIRQMEAALSNAERKLQSIFQAQFEQQHATRGQVPISPRLQRETPPLPPPPPPQVMAQAEESGKAMEPEAEAGSTDVVSPDADTEMETEEETEVETEVETEMEAEVETEVEGDSPVQSTDDRENGDGYVEKSSEATIVNVNMKEEPPAPKQVVIDIPSEEVGERTIALPNEMTEVPIGAPGEEYFSSKVNSRKFEEAISSEGLTLI